MNVLLLGAETATATGVLKTLSHDTVLLFLLQLGLLVFMARVLGEVMRRWQQPPVIGELLAGIVLGPSLLGLIFPELQLAIFPKIQTQSDVLGAVAWLGVLLLLFITGLETDVDLIRRKAKVATSISLGGIILPFGSGFLLGQLLPDYLLAQPLERLEFSLFIGVAMSITALPVLAKVLIDLKLVRRDIGQITLAAGMSDDVVGWILLSIVSGLASSGTLNWTAAVIAIGGAFVWIAFIFTLGRVWVLGLMQWVDDEIGTDEAMLGLLLVLMLFAATITHALRIEAALGAFTMGMLVGQSRRLRQSVRRSLEVVTISFLAPIFFASAGLKVNLITLFTRPELLLFALLVLFVACFGKFVGAYVGARYSKLTHWEGLALGAGMNARGALEIIVATIGLSLGILNQEMFSIIVLMAIVTSLMAPPLLRFFLDKVEIQPEEKARLDREARAQTGFVQGIRRILLPTRGGANVQLAAQLVGYLARQQPVEVTALYAANNEPKRSWLQQWFQPTEPSANLQEVQVALDLVDKEMQLPPELPLTKRVLFGYTKQDIILREAQKGYSLIVLGATEQESKQGVLFNSLVDDILRHAPCATLVVKSRIPMGDSCLLEPIAPQRLQRILVPTVGTEYAKHAAEFAYILAQSTGAMVTLLHVVIRPQVQEVLVVERQDLDHKMMIGEQIVDIQAELALAYQVEVQTRVLEGDTPEKEIVEFANRGNYDLVILGTLLRQIGLRAFFGHRVEYVLDHTVCPVAVLTSA